VIYLIFTEGYAATSGSDWVRRDLADEAMRLGRVLAALLNRQPEAHGLLALMELQASRFDTRTGPSGTPVLLQDQDRSHWDRTLIRHGLAALTPRSDWAGPSARTRSRRPSPAAMPGPARSTRRTGRRSSPSTTRWPRSRRRPWSSSTGRLR